MRLFSLLAAALLLLAPVTASLASPILIVAAENFYGDIAQQIGGPQVAVTSILSNPDQDPHLFEASPSVARALSAARIVIYNGIDYDPWIVKLLGAAAGRNRTAIVVAQLIGRKPGDNPHIWYDPQTMPALAGALADELGRADPVHAADYRERLVRFRSSLAPIEAKIAVLRARLAGTLVTATEPVCGDLFAALAMQVRNGRFQLAVMNNTEPSASDVAAFEDDLRNRKVRLLVYNSQASDPVAVRLVNLAKASRIPVVGASETEPPGKRYQEWMLSELSALERALSE
ncbi:MAG TPA: zinc ABC transporter substrate-binding protein [Stellaceae bacterium]|nr:zinc ABC transporter substrate-binding protein [Stellaceae bacterium]